MWFPLEPADLSYADAAPHSLVTEKVVPASPERLFEIITTGERQDAWFKDLRDTKWTSPAPQGVGSTRDVHLKTLSVKERFLAWEPGRRLAFTMYAITLPLTTRMMEDIRFERVGAKSTKVSWRLHYAPSALMRPVHPLAKRFFGKMFRDTVDGLGRYAENHP
jgi:uncharacterized protein YndB with AHSA1/START domain